MKAFFARRYGASPLHLLGHVACFAFAAYAVAQLLQARRADNIFLWLLGAVVLHDVLFLPFYSALDRIARRGTRRLRAVNHLRVPALISGLLLLVFFPAILGRNAGSFERVSGVGVDGYAGRWLLVTAGLFGASAVLYAVRGRRAARRPPPSR